MQGFGDLEAAIMDRLWDWDHAATVREMLNDLAQERRLAYTTVMTVMGILHGKGVLRREKHGRAWRYWPAETKAEHDARLMAEVLRSGRDHQLTIRRFLERVSEDEMASLRRAVFSADRAAS